MNAGEHDLAPSSAHMMFARGDQVVNECLVCCSFGSCFYFLLNVVTADRLDYSFFMAHLRVRLLCCCKHTFMCMQVGKGCCVSRGDVDGQEAMFGGQNYYCSTFPFFWGGASNFVM